ncbi:MAG: hypothetical protein H7263_02395 [Candidatus Sericytochromatia bacterium]|nr:hypothetical protein [Candidatus Sericytochromatia bacterium]
MERYNKKLILNSSEGGRPDDVDELAMLKIKDNVLRLENDFTVKVTPQMVQKMFHQGKIETLIRKRRTAGQFITLKGCKKIKDDDGNATQTKYNKIVPVEDLTLDVRTVTNYKKHSNIRDRAAQDLTEARMNACKDVRLFFQLACMYKAYGDFLTAPYKSNADCTTLILPPQGSGRKVCVVREYGEKKRVQSVGVNLGLNVLFKIFGLGNAAGELAPLLVIVGVKGIPPNKFFKASVPGLNHSTERTAGTMYFAHSKMGCDDMWEDIFLTFVIPFLKGAADFHQHRVGIFWILDI